MRDEKVAGKETTCVEIARGSREKREVCANVDTGLLDRTKEGYTDSGPLPVGSKLFPRSMSLVKGGVSVVKVEITDLDTTQSAISLFEPPAGAVSKRGCMQPVPGHKVKDSVPNYPTEERLAKHEGTVEVFVVIDKSGIPQELHVVSGASPGLDKSALEAIRKWRYEPAKCDGDAVEFETNVTVRFWFE